jgi:hypothetical protein
LAQRAYRERKESAVENLKRRVIELEQLNETMGKEYTSLTDIILHQNSIQSFPDIAQQIKNGTIKLLHMTQEAEDEEGEYEVHVPGNTSSVPEVPCLDSSNSSGTISRSCPSPRLTSSSTVETSCPTIIEVRDLQSQSTGPPGPNRSSNSQAGDIGQKCMQADLSFPDTNSSTGYEYFGAALPGVAYNTTMQPPRSYAAQEITFGRRLHRSSQEVGSLLASMESPPPLLYMKTFGFCLHFENRQEIARRMRFAATQARDSTLNNWKYPFTNLGGAGLFFPDLDGSCLDETVPGTGLPIGNRAIHESYKPAEMTGLSMGPFSEEVEAIRDLRLNSQFRILEPGFQGDFFDSDEIEICLRSYGVTILPGKDFVTAYVDMAIFEPQQEPFAVIYENGGLPISQEGFVGNIASAYASGIPKSMEAAERRGGQHEESLNRPAFSPLFGQYPSHSTSSGSTSRAYGRSTPHHTDWKGSHSVKTKVMVDVECLITG